jgi:hypothetical protein
MANMRHRCLPLLAALACCCLSLPAHAQGGFIPPASAELIAEISRADRELFDAVFNSCDTRKLAAIVAEDFEFYHDKSGLASTSGSQWVEGVRQMCERQAKGTDYRARRELDSASVKVYPMQNYGAVHMGLHRFYRKLADGKEQLVEVALFTNLWKREKDGWKLTRVLSYDHRDAR